MNSFWCAADWSKPRAAPVSLAAFRPLPREIDAALGRSDTCLRAPSMTTPAATYLKLKERTLKLINPSPTGRGLGEGRRAPSMFIPQFDPHPPRIRCAHVASASPSGRGGNHEPILQFTHIWLD